MAESEIELSEETHKPIETEAHRRNTEPASVLEQAILRMLCALETEQEKES